LQLIHKQTPGDKDVHLILDNYSTHKTPEVRAWLKKHPRFHLHFTPTSSSWLNQVERFFRDLTDKCVRRGIPDSGAVSLGIHDELDGASNQMATLYVTGGTASHDAPEAASRFRPKTPACSPTAGRRGFTWRGGASAPPPSVLPVPEFPIH
jgi:hypothetical protein